MKRYVDLLREYEALAKKEEVEEEGIKIIMLHCSNMPGNELYMRMSEVPAAEFTEKFIAACHKYLYEKLPVQHITGYVYFFNYKFMVSKYVLIPRRETEELVENTIYLYDEIFAEKSIKILDIGTGSGCIAITLSKEIKNCEVCATDISKDALVVAQENAKSLNAEVDFLLGSLFEPVENKKFDLIVSNPPYIPKKEEVSKLVKDNEPHIALFGGEDGLYFYREIIKNARYYLNKKSIIGFEHAFDKAKEIKDLALTYFPEAEIRQYKDMQKKDRMTFIINHGPVFIKM